ncbi:adenylate/guanylate cyclase domain-containing protein [Stutzerimonas kirkiae]|uniref:adenylate/guanylate cyclase domain-containing protein n=1 Tax=Stutzerimonas kirkiae TaxID=2211392 RepID=UPI0010383D29|nr:adenylate/guanylate cyclase domain-containing protein [Stutzerimonas kirkiae]TBV11363.1 adenylate cyclase [Stutzerimonas kirkiae]TBV12472.1 adenylate cyclase [Stutzerimonas kirkiae]
MTSAISEQRPTPASRPSHTYHARTLAYAGIGAILATGVHGHAFSPDLLWMLPYLMIYPHFAQALDSFFRRRYPSAIKRTLLLVDAMHNGAFIALSGLSLAPYLMLLLSVGATAFIIDRLNYLPLTLPLLNVAALLYLVLLPLESTGPYSLVLDLSGIVGMALYACVNACHMHRQGLHLAQSHAEMEAMQSRIICLARYLSPQISESIFSGKHHTREETRRSKLTVFFSDIKGFSELSEELEAEALTDMLNQYLDEMSKIALEHGGTIDKFVGDCIMVFFGDPSSNGTRADAISAVSMAIAMRKRMSALRRQWRIRGMDCPLEVRMGIHTGYCSVGNFGTEARMDYTIIGREVNLASRLENAAEAGEILISHKTYALIRKVIMCHSRGPVSGKGLSRQIQAYQVIDLYRELGAHNGFVEHDMPGFSMYLDTNDVRIRDRERIITALQQAASKLQGLKRT